MIWTGHHETWGQDYLQDLQSTTSVVYTWRTTRNYVKITIHTQELGKILPFFVTNEAHCNIVYDYDILLGLCIDVELVTKSSSILNTKYNKCISSFQFSISEFSPSTM